MSKEKSPKLADIILHKAEHVADIHPAQVQEAQEFCEGYKTFLNSSKTERECVKTVVGMLKKAGYKKMENGKKYKAGDRVYYVNRGKAVMAATIGKKSLAEGVHMTAAHLDAPRLDLKPRPLYEAEGMAYFKTHYYGGIRKYQWVTMPLAMHGTVVKKDGSTVDITIGEEKGEPVFTITDLLPHLSQDQNKRSLAEGIKGEELNILIGALPFSDKDEKDRTKLEAMRFLHEKYGITERDFTRAELEFVPAAEAKDIGFDRSLLGAYGQDDRVCCYTTLMAEINKKIPEKTTVCVLVDKEETGSAGNTGLQSDFLFHFLEDLAQMQDVVYRHMLEKSFCLSADVDAAYDPTFPDVYDRKNAVFINHGVAVSKYGGARGKAGTSDASAETVGYITSIFDKADVVWQSGEMGRIDLGGGGTVAQFVAKRNMDVIDVGVPVLCMHSPFEVTSKLDVYQAYRGFLSFAQAK